MTTSTGNAMMRKVPDPKSEFTEIGEAVGTFPCPFCGGRAGGGERVGCVVVHCPGFRVSATLEDWNRCVTPPALAHEQAGKPVWDARWIP